MPMTSNSHVRNYDIAVVGAGPVGLTTTLALQNAGYSTICVGPRPSSDTPDRRTTALLDGSIQFLGNQTAIWPELSELSAPLKTLQLIDRTGRLLRAPDTCFRAEETGVDAFGYNIPNSDLLDVLLNALGDGLLVSQVTALTTSENTATLDLSSGESITARLIIGADGRNSFCRSSADISTRSWAYDQVAIVCNIHHSHPHHGLCTEFHYPSGPFTVVPLPGDWSSLVWVERKEAAAELAALDNGTFTAQLDARLNRQLGKILDITPRGAFPLSALIANKLTAHRLALVGEAAHVMPPIGAQGLNLGFRDAADLIKIIAGSDDPGASACLAAYNNKRHADVWIRTLAADLLNRTLIANSPLFQIARSSGLAALTSAKPLKKLAMKVGMSAQ